MPACLLDTNIWLAALFTSHPLHRAAQGALQRATAEAPALFCRATQQSFLRLATTPALLKAYGVNGMTNRDAWVALDAFQALPQVAEIDEPPGTTVAWRALATRDTASPKLWMDAYLAAFAISGGFALLTMDRDFANFVPHRLNVQIISS